MDLYIEVYLIMIVAWFVSKVLKKTEFLMFVLVCVIIISLPALRFKESSADTYNYIKYFLQPNLGYNGIKPEFGYALFDTFLHSITQNWHIFIIVSTLISMLPISFFVNKFSKDKILSMIILYLYGPVICYYFSYFGNIRQCMSIGFIALMFMTLESKLRMDKILSVVSFIIAVSLHASSLVVFPLLFISKYNFSRRNVIIVTIVSVIVGTLDLSQWFNALTYVGGLERSFYFSVDDYGINGLSPTLMASMIFGLFIYFTSDEKIRQSVFLKSFLIMGWLLCFLASSVSSNLDRFVFAFYLSVLIILPEYLNSSIVKMKYKFAIGLIFIAFYTYRFIVNLGFQERMFFSLGSPVPYHSFLE